jgi:hypothetical protein
MKHMSNLFIILTLFSVILLCFCKKNNNNNNNTEEYSSNLPDSIVYTNLNPDTSVSSVRKNLSPFSWPPAKDSSASISLDIDHDNITDLKFFAHIRYQFFSASDPQANYDYGLSFGTIRDQDFVAIQQTGPYCYYTARAFNKDSVIFKNSLYSIGQKLYNSGFYYDPCNCNTFSYDTNGTYYGFKIYDLGTYEYGWILLSGGGSILTVKEFAINKTRNKPIKAGQKN